MNITDIYFWFMILFLIFFIHVSILFIIKMNGQKKINLECTMNSLSLGLENENLLSLNNDIISKLKLYNNNNNNNNNKFNNNVKGRYIRIESKTDQILKKMRLSIYDDNNVQITDSKQILHTNMTDSFGNKISESLYTAIITNDVDIMPFNVVFNEGNFITVDLGQDVNISKIFIYHEDASFKMMINDNDDKNVFTSVDSQSQSQSQSSIIMFHAPFNANNNPLSIFRGIF